MRGSAIHEADRTFETDSAVDLDRRLDQLRRSRPRSRWLRVSGLLAVALAAIAWSSPGLEVAELFSARRLANLERFLGELRPYPLQGQPWNLGVAWQWAFDLLQTRGWEALGSTLALSVVAIVLAGAGALLAVPFASRSLARAEPYLPGARPAGPIRRGLWWLVVATSRTALVLLRSIPEYVLAFLLLALLGPNAWPIVLALAVHNLGILGKLGAEVVEDLEPATLAALRGLGAGRGQLLLAGVVPQALPRFLLLFFYRWETCVREATVLGMLGITSLGFRIVDARARQHLDVMAFYILLGAVLVIVGDLVSALVRGWVRRAA